MINSPQTPTDQKIRAIEEHLNITFPQDYRSFLADLTQNSPSAKKFTSLDGKIHSSVTAFSLPTPSATPNILDEFNGITARKLIPKHLIPIAMDPIQNRIVLSTLGDDYGSVYYWSWDEEPRTESCSYRYMTLIARSFSDFIDSLRA